MAAKFIFDIGPHKTGTTSIQKMLYCESRVKDAKFIYPFTNHNATGQHTFAQMAGEPQHPAFKEMLLDLKRADKTWVLSSEELCYLGEEALASIRDALPQADISIVFYQRNVLTLLHSWWQEKIKHGSTQSFLEFVFDCILMSQHLHLLIPDVLLGAWGKYFGRGAIRIFLFDQIPDVTIQFAADMLDFDLSSESTRVINRSYDYIDCELMRFWNMHGFWGAGVIQSPDVHLIRFAVSELSSRFVGEFCLNYEIQEFARIEQRLLSCWRDRIEGADDVQLFASRQASFSYIRSAMWTAHPDLAERLRKFASERPEYSSRR